MFLHLFVLFVILVVGAFLSLRINTNDRGHTDVTVSYVKAAISGVVFFAYLFILAPSFGTIDSGSKGVVIRLGAVTDRVLDPGLYLVVPLLERVQGMDTQTRTFSAHADTGTHDLQSVSTDVSINYQVDPSKVGSVYADLRQDYEIRVLAPTVQDVVKAATAMYAAEELLTQRSSVVDTLERLLSQKVSSSGLLISRVNLTNFKFSDEFERAIEAKVVAEQNVQVEMNKLKQVQVSAQTQVTQAKAAAEATVARATGEAEATKLNGEAAAYAIKVKAEALQANPNLVNLNAIDKWDGKLPSVQVPGGSVPFLQLPTPK